MMKFAYFLLSSFVVVACQYSHRLAEEVEKQELAYKSDSTITIDMEECVVAQKRLSELIKKREPFYKQADFEIDTENKELIQIVDEILEKYGTIA